MVPGELDMAGGLHAAETAPTGLWRWLDGSWRGGLPLVLLCLAVYLPGFFTLPAVDRDEARFAQASRQMMESGDYVVPRIQGRPRLNKPPLIYWLQSTAARVLTRGHPMADGIWMYRIPSLLGAMITVLATWRLGCSMFNPKAGWLAAAILVACPILFWEARQARADMVLVACTTVAVWMLWEVWTSEWQRARNGDTQRRAATPDYSHAPTTRVPTFLPPFLRLFVLWTAIAAGVLTKGPITPMVIGLAVLTVSIATRRWRWIWRLQPLLGILLIAATIGPWIYLVSRQVGWDTYISTIKDEVLGRSLEPKEGHGGFPGYHTLLMPILLFPGSVLIGLGLWQAAKSALTFARTERSSGPSPSPAHLLTSSPAHLFLLSTLLPTWLILELVGTKLPHYTMPLYPLLALIATSAACSNSFESLLRRRPVVAALVAFFMLIPAALLASGVIYGISLGTIGKAMAASIMALFLVAAFSLAAAAAYRRRDMPSLLLTGLLAFTIAIVQVADALPRFDDLWVSREIASKLDAIDPTHQRPIATVAATSDYPGYQEDSLIFNTRARIERIDDADLVPWMAQHKDGLVVVPADPKYMKLNIVIRANPEGFNYSKGRNVYLAIVEPRH
jgi:4-amino-4-deoxy-L-arabinose transferase-like glycosyltransferase